MHTHEGFISPCDSEYCDALDRMLTQAEKGLAQEPIPGVYPGLYGLTLEQVRLGNIAAIARTALR